MIIVDSLLLWFIFGTFVGIEIYKFKTEFRKK